MAYAVDEAGTVVGILAYHAAQITEQFAFVFPVVYGLLQVFDHVVYTDIGTAMLRTFQRTDACGNRGVGVGTGRRGHAHGKGGVVTAAMLCLQDEQQVERAGIKRRVVVAQQHVQEVLGQRIVLFRVTDVERAALCLVAQHVVGIGNDGGELRSQLYALAHQVVARNVIGRRVVGVEFKHAAGQYVHDVTAFQFDNAHHGLGHERHVLHQKAAKFLQLFGIGQIAREQQVGHLFKAEASFFD